MSVPIHFQVDKTKGVIRRTLLPYLGRVFSTFPRTHSLLPERVQLLSTRRAISFVLISSSLLSLLSLPFCNHFSTLTSSTLTCTMADNGDTPKKTPRKRAKKDSTLTPAKMADSSMESPTKRSKIAPTPLLPQGLDLSDADMKVLILALSCSEALKVCPHLHLSLPIPTPSIQSVNIVEHST